MPTAEHGPVYFFLPPYREPIVWGAVQGSSTTRRANIKGLWQRLTGYCHRVGDCQGSGSSDRLNNSSSLFSRPLLSFVLAIQMVATTSQASRRLKTRNGLVEQTLFGYGKGLLSMHEQA